MFSIAILCIGITLMGVVVSAIVGSGTYLLLLLLPGLSEFQRAAIVPAWLMMGVLFGSYGSVGIVLSRTKTQSGRNWIKVYVITIICGLMWGGLWGLLLSPLSFPLFFVFHRAGFMLPGFSHIEPDANPPETATVTGSPASSVVVFGCRTPQCIRNSPPSSLRVWHSAAHAPARF